MLIINPIQEKEEQEKICGMCGVEFDECAMAYAAREDEEIIGIVQFRILGKYGVIYDLANAAGVDDLEALIITGKVALNFIDLCGVQDAIIKTENRNLPKILGFKKDDDGVYKINLEGYFDAPCSKK